MRAPLITRTSPQQASRSTTAQRILPRRAADRDAGRASTHDIDTPEQVWKRRTDRGRSRGCPPPSAAPRPRTLVRIIAERPRNADFPAAASRRTRDRPAAGYGTIRLEKAWLIVIGVGRIAGRC